MIGILERKVLLLAERDGRYQTQNSNYYFWHREAGFVSVADHVDSPSVDGVPNALTNLLAQHGLDQASASSLASPPNSFVCVFQPARPHHRSGIADRIPFESPAAVSKLFQHLDLPRSYLLLADDALTSVQAHVQNDAAGRPSRYEFIAHCLNKQGDWAVALSYRPKTRSTSVFWSVDARLNPEHRQQDLLDFSGFCFHPVLVPCIMFAAVFEGEVQRRHSIKARLRWLQGSLARMTSLSTQGYREGFDLEIANALHQASKSLEGCRSAQESRRGRYHMWKAFHEAIEKGFDVVERTIDDSWDPGQCQCHRELKQWANIVSQKLDSMKARDQDVVDRVSNAASVLYSLVQQRDMRVQSSIATAAQRDSEDMKFIAVLGSIFLPASLVASVLNVQEFSSCPGRRFLQPI